MSFLNTDKNYSSGYENISEGFSDAELKGLWITLFNERGITPWAAKESESTSFGKRFRNWSVKNGHSGVASVL